MSILTWLSSAIGISVTFTVFCVLVGLIFHNWEERK